MRLTLIAAAIIFAASTTTYAITPKSSKPEKCPSVSAIKITLQDLKKPAGYEYWFVDMVKPFDTNDNWTFILSQIYADSQNDAYKKAKDTLDSAKLYQGPIESDTHKNVWACVYSANGYNMMAITPPENS